MSIGSAAYNFPSVNLSRHHSMPCMLPSTQKLIYSLAGQPRMCQNLMKPVSRTEVSTSTSNISSSMNNVDLVNNQVSICTHIPNKANLFVDVTVDAVDTWIDRLSTTMEPFLQSQVEMSAAEITSRWIINQNLPRLDIPKFSGKPKQWVEFIIHFHQMVHIQPYLSSAQRVTYLIQHLEGEAKRSVQGFNRDWIGYVSALKRLKLMFGQKVTVAQAYISELTKGKQVRDDDMDGLAALYYQISDCLSTLTRLQYFADLQSTEFLRQVIKRLPHSLQNKWCEKSYSIRKKEEPSLVHLEEWLQHRILMYRDPYIPHLKGKDGFSNYNTGIEESPRKQVVCSVCDKPHLTHRCRFYLDKTPDKRLQCISDKNLCHNCLRPNHEVTECNSKYHCQVGNCTEKHHSSLHESMKSSTTKDIHVGFTTMNSNVFMKVIPVIVTAQSGKRKSTYAFLDDGCESTLIRKDFADELCMKGSVRHVTVTTFTDKIGERISSSQVSFEIIGKNANVPSISIKDAFTIPKESFQVRPQYLPNNFYSDERYKHLQGFGFKDINADDITIVIGLDNHSALLITDIKHGDETAPVAAKTALGWSIFGKDESDISSIKPCSLQCNHIRVNNKDDELMKMVEEFWVTESFGTRLHSSKPYSQLDRLLEQQMEKSSTIKNGHYCVGMLWKESILQLPNNRKSAEKRFQCLESRLKRQPHLHEKYKSVINNYILKGYARKLPKDEEVNSSDKTWYLPHHPVLNPNKPGKVRVVFDAAAKTQGQSLNDNLHTGPDLNNDLVGVLLRFRKYPVAIVADIEAMFHQVCVKDGDTDSLRFLWKQDLNQSRPDTYQMLVHIFGAKCSPSCASFALKKTAMDNQNYFPEAVTKSVMRDFYVDDLLKSLQNDDIAIKYVKDMISVLNSGGFHLTKFISNSQNVLIEVPEAQLSESQRNFSINEEITERTLGVRWDIHNDHFTFCSTIKEHTITKRNVLRIVSSIFDPLGFLAPLTITAKIFLQGLWRKQYKWDDQLLDEESQVWKKWLLLLKEISLFSMPRCYIEMSHLHILELHIFVDASEAAFCAVAFLRVIYNDGNIQCRNIMSKSRLVPLKVLTIPRLELQSAVLGVKMKNVLVEEIDLTIRNTQFWTDSMITLQYIQNESKRFKVFVANRISEIRQHSDTNQWRHISGDLNPADDMTRELSISDIGTNSRWVSGPQFLNMDDSQWPIAVETPPITFDDPELRIMVSAVEVDNSSDLLGVIQSRYSNWTQLLDIFAWILRFVNSCKRNFPAQQFLTAKERKQAHNHIVLLIQENYFPCELKALRKGQSLPVTSPLLQLSPFIDPHDRTMRVGGRLSKCHIKYTAKHQQILPKHCKLTELIAIHHHIINAHCPPEQLLASLRQTYWIVHSRRLVKKLTTSCIECRKQYSRPAVPLMADLPHCRVTPNCPVFHFTGIDFFGPMFVKIGRGKVRPKRWGCIFTCLVTRAIHLEIIEFLETDTFINGLERFRNRRGSPGEILSDCGSNFKGADMELKQCLADLNQTDIGRYAAREGITWKFNPPKAPHMGGSWERLVKSVKIALKHILKDRILTDFQLLTIFTEVEAILNSRPLTPTSDHIEDLEALTPNHFILVRASNNLSPGIVCDKEISSRKLWKQVQILTEHFWKRWVKEYLPTLTQRSKWKSEIPRNIEYGDLVLVIDDGIPRGYWKLARVVQIHPGNDGRVRVAEIKTATGTLIRPVAKLCLLETSK